MQIDFHHAVTYVCARLAGFADAEAATVAYAAQYVDDATNSGVVRFDNGAQFKRMSSAHKLFDYRNFQNLANSQVWIPFHFLPGNGGMPADRSPSGGFIEKLICRANSPIAQDMVRECIVERHSPYALQRLGITMHVYADTWAHQGFVGVNHRVNEARNLVDGQGQVDRRLLDRLKGYFIGEALPLGHGAVLGNPDKPFLRWGYTNGRGERIQRDNLRDFVAAAVALCDAMKRFHLGEPAGVVSPMLEADRQMIAALFANVTEHSSHRRHKQWATAIAAGKFSFGPANITYIPKGKGSWKHQALGTEKALDRSSDIFPYRDSFLTSDWKRFHDALQAHHFYVIHELLPQYGICVA
ncbi:hypothetical protein IQ266_13080 [filamentous cyanobacterium LEGE 11480]|uniref:Uncharacterized protein n=1 Tax=Romeriopsis navalis LEGE 11480 TaxID=2777977 RepID=A0A928VLB7_9CYAN|nr:DUF6765 family protein [Romeriopsis navalis]MBE9030666.1 hypothetical protein [Romeriopsis navalis LEGE 11480]